MGWEQKWGEGKGLGGEEGNCGWDVKYINLYKKILPSQHNYTRKIELCATHDNQIWTQTRTRIWTQIQTLALTSFSSNALSILGQNPFV